MNKTVLVLDLESHISCATLPIVNGSYFYFADSIDEAEKFLSEHADEPPCCIAFTFETLGASSWAHSLARRFIGHEFPILLPIEVTPTEAHSHEFSAGERVAPSTTPENFPCRVKEIILRGGNLRSQRHAA